MMRERRLVFGEVGDLYDRHRPAYPDRLIDDLVASAGLDGGRAVLEVGAGTGKGDGDVRALGPTVGFLAAMLLIADGCRREGLFEAMGAVMARGSGGAPRRLLAFVFVIATATTVVLSLDAKIVLLTPVVFATAARMRTSAKPHMYACAHLANSASLLLPVSNLTNLLAFHATRAARERCARNCRGMRSRCSCSRSPDSRSAR